MCGDIGMRKVLVVGAALCMGAWAPVVDALFPVVGSACMCISIALSAW
jgi:hypothetical protein